MSGRGRAPAWTVIAAAVAVILAAALLALVGARMASGLFGLMRTGGASSPDPQFALQEAAATRPPEPDAEAGAPQSDEDPSAHWDLGEQTPVDRTAAELAREAAAER